LRRSSQKSVYFWQSAAASFLQLAPKSHNRKEGSGLFYLCKMAGQREEATARQREEETAWQREEEMARQRE